VNEIDAMCAVAVMNAEGAGALVFNAEQLVLILLMGLKELFVEEKMHECVV
jgi:hypothetical protein